jgi:uncharacterized protein YbjT (DUF2867 family)
MKDTSIHKVLVAGATGYIGSRIAAALARRGYAVRALVRSPQRLAVARDALELFTGHATRMETLEGLCDGVDAVVSSLGLRSFRRRPGAYEVDFQANRNILQRAEQAGVGRFVFVGVLNGRELSECVPILRSREQFIDDLRRSSMRWTVLRPTGAFNDAAEILRMAERGRVYLMGDGARRFNPIDAADIADQAIRVLADPRTAGEEIELGGPDAFTHREVAELAFSICGARPRITHLPLWMVDAVVRAIRPVNANAAGFLQFFRWASTVDMLGAPCGKRRLADFFRDSAARRGPHG